MTPQQTIRSLLNGRAHVVQYTILMRADVLFAGSRCGRYYQGVLTDAEVQTLVEGIQ